MRRVLTRLLIVVVLLGSAAAGVIPAMSWWQLRSQPKYLTAAVSRGRVETVVNSTGTVKAIRSVSVGAFTSGPIKEIYVDFNSRVKKDQLLALIDPELADAAVARDEAALAAQKADLERMTALRDQAWNNEKRARRLLAINKDYLSETDMDQYRFALQTNEAQLRLGQATIKQAQATLNNSLKNREYTKIISPVDGIVIERKVDPGQTVAASFQTPELFIIAPEMDRHMYVFASVDEADIGLIYKAQQKEREEQKSAVKFTVDAWPGELFDARIYEIRKNSTTTQNVVTYPVVIEAPNSELNAKPGKTTPDLKLMPGMTANITFQIEGKDDILRVPAAALRYIPPAAMVRPEDKHYVDGTSNNPIESGRKRSANEKADQARNRLHRLVWVQEGPLLRAVPVTIGLTENQFAELIEGELTEGQAVVTGTESLFAPR
jgi:HlyD family secretion protein